jgi:hypothetical protein
LSFSSEPDRRFVSMFIPIALTTFSPSLFRNFS